MNTRVRWFRVFRSIGLAITMAFPLVSSASSITNTFLSSTSGTAQIDIGDTIVFEVSITLNTAQKYTTVFFTLSGDQATASGESLPFATTAHAVTGWAWHYTKNAGTGGTKVNFSTTSRQAPNTAAEGALPPPGPVSGLFGFLADATGSGTTSMVGTVTIVADANGEYVGGAYLQPFVAAFEEGPGLPDTVTINGGDFTVGTVVPEPGTALLVALGLAGLAAKRSRPKRS